MVRAMVMDSAVVRMALVLFLFICVYLCLGLEHYLKLGYSSGKGWVRVQVQTRVIFATRD